MPKDIYLFGDIGDSFWSDGITDKQVQQDLNTLERADSHTVHINSMGGATHHGVAIFNLLESHKKKQQAINPNYQLETVVDGFAYSAASIILLAGDKRIVNAGSRVMIHNAWMYASGDYRDMEKAAEYLKKARDSTSGMYQQVTGKSKKTIDDMMNAETYFLPQEAVDLNLATEVGTMTTSKDKTKDNTSAKKDPYEANHKVLVELTSGYVQCMLLGRKERKSNPKESSKNSREVDLSRLLRDVEFDRILLESGLPN